MIVGLTGISIAILVAGRNFLVPLVVGILVFVLMSAAIEWVTRIRIGPLRPPYWAAATIGLVAFGGIMFAIYGILASETQAMIAAWPAYALRIEALIGSLDEWLGHEIVAGFLSAFEGSNVVSHLRTVAGSAGYAATMVVVVFLYASFLFVERSYFPKKLERMFPDGDRASRVASVLGLITDNVRRYVLVKSAISAGTSIAVYLVMYAVGLQFAKSIAVLTFFLNFIPSIGSIAATVIPSVLALAQFESWTPFLVVVTGITAIQFVIGQFIDPLLTSRALNLSSLVIVLSLTFWAAVWGLVGMFLAVPLMVVVLVVCSHVPELQAVAVLLSKDGSLTRLEADRVS